jgi:hypothetical protein
MFNETQQMLLVHHARVMYMRIDFTQVVKIADAEASDIFGP